LEELAAAAGKSLVGASSGRGASGAADSDVPVNKLRASSLERFADERPDMHERVLKMFIHPRKVLPQFPSVTADEATTARIRDGRTVNLPDLSRARQVKVFAGQRELIAIATRIAGTLFHPKIVLCG